MMALSGAGVTRIAWAVTAIGFVPVASSAAVQCGTANQAGASVCFIDPAVDREARCNDGTVPAFWVRPGSGSGASRWVIWLEGGSACTDQASCAMRAQDAGNLLTSTGFETASGDGVLSSDSRMNPLLYNANTVLVHYCSSDNWSGGYSTASPFKPNDPTTWNFQGRRIVLAAVASLRELKLGFAGAKQILLGGSSAGGVGITVTANDVLPVLPNAPEVLLANDAGFALDIGQYDPTVKAPHIYPAQPNAFDAYFTNGMSLWHGHGDTKCAAAAHTLQDRIDCYNSSLIMQKGLVARPSFAAESQLDLAQISDELCPALYGRCSVPHDPRSTEGVYATAFGAEMASTLVGAHTPAAYGVYAPNSYLHVLLTSSTVFTTKYSFPAGQLTVRDVFDGWLRNPGGKRIVDIGNGTGVALRH